MIKRFLIYSTIILTALILGGRMFSEDLEQENGQVSASTLPLDAEIAKIDYRTATFGMG